MANERIGPRPPTPDPGPEMVSSLPSLTELSGLVASGALRADSEQQQQQQQQQTAAC